MLPGNPFTIRGTIDRCWLFTYQAPEEEARALLPRRLELVTRAGCAFWSVVLCHLSHMRPKPLPAFLGISYWHVAYRLYVRFHPASGPPVEGLYFLRSDCDRALMTRTGNLLTNYNFHTAGIEVVQEPARVCLSVRSPDARAAATIDREQPPRLPAHSAFASLDEAAAFLKYQPRGISITPDGKASIVAIQRDEAAWRSRLVTVVEAQWQFFEGKTVRPEICYEVEPIDYQWNRAQRVP
jgi:uncharacterized protein YqjF (DUF2071 family)